MVGIAMTSSTNAGAMVHASSSPVWPRICAGSPAVAERSRYRNRASPSTTNTTPAMPAAAHVMMEYTERVARFRSEPATRVDMGPSNAHPPASVAARTSVQTHIDPRVLARGFTAVTVARGRDVRKRGAGSGGEVEKGAEQDGGAALDGRVVARLVD